MDRDDESVEEESIEFFPIEKERERDNDDDDDKKADDDKDNEKAGAKPDDDLDTMADEKKTTEIDLDLTKTELKPIYEPELYDVLDFIRLLANKAGMVGKQRHPSGGYADLVETATAYKAQLGANYTTMPGVPTKPKQPVVADYTTTLDYTAACMEYKSMSAKYVEYLIVTAALKKAIQTKFPSLALYFKSSKYGCLPADKTPREILELMAEHTISDDSERDRLAMEMTQKMHHLQYRPSKMGPLT